MFSLMRAQEANGDATAVLAMHDPRNLPSSWDKYFVSELDTRAAGQGAGAFRQAGRALWSAEAAGKMRALLRAFHPDVVHAHNIYTHLSPSVLAECHRADTPVVMTVHDYALVSANYALWDNDRPLTAGRNGFLRVARSRFIKGSFAATAMLEAITRLHRTFGLVDRYVDRYVTLSHFVKDVMVSVGYDATKIAVVTPGIEAISYKRKAERKYALFVGRLETYKGVSVFVDALRHCKNISARIVGDGSLRLSESARIRALGLAPAVRCDGFLSGDALEEAYASATVLVVPSLWYEPFGLVVLEAMARGVPVIVSDRGGLPEAVGGGLEGEGGDGGIIVTAGDVLALAGAMQRFFDEPAWAAEMGEKARIRAAAFGDPTAHLARIRGIYEACG